MTFRPFLARIVPAVLRGNEQTSLRRASPTIGGYLFLIVFALPMLLEAAWLGITEAWKLRGMDVRSPGPPAAPGEDSGQGS